MLELVEMLFKLCKGSMREDIGTAFRGVKS